MAAGLPVPVPAPPAQPPRIGLLPSFRALDEAADRTRGNDDDVEGRPIAQYVLESGAGWEHGFAFAPEQCASSGRDSWDCTTPGSARSIPANPGIVATRPFEVWAADACSPFDTTRDWQGRADRMLAASESFQVAAELWTGSVAQASTDPDGSPWPNLYLAHPSADILNDPNGDPPLSVVDALACLEFALGECGEGSRGVVHCTRQLATHWTQRGMLRREGALLLTMLDTIVVADAGYDGSSPAGVAEAPGSQWAYGTGLPQIRLGPVHHLPETQAEQDALAAEFNSPQAQRLDRDTNLIAVYSQRAAAVTWDNCCHLAVKVDLPLCYVGGAS